MDFTKVLVAFWSGTLPMLCVPMFFIISGYLSSFNTIRYTRFLQKKFKTLVIPYLAWNILTFGFRFLVKISPLGRFCSTMYNFDNPAELISHIFFGPELIPLWFLRNLILFFVLFPLILLVVKKTSWISLIIALIINELCDPLGGIFYFTLGVVVGLNVHNMNYRKNNKIFAYGGCLIYFAASILFALQPNISDKAYITMPVILIGCAGIFLLVPDTISHTVHNVSSPSMIFFMYAFHGIISPYIIKSVLLFIPLSGWSGIMAYMLCCFLVIGLTFMGWKILCALIPWVIYFLTGGRKLTNSSPL